MSYNYDTLNVSGYGKNVTCCCRAKKMYAALYELSVADDNIWPEKYLVEDYPRIRDFPAQHPNKGPSVQAGEKKDEL